ncbi:MAG: hypothetical protein J7549_07965 [Variovorax sp.]|nr:hypothetical protein [Variovorax sp.]
MLIVLALVAAEMFFPETAASSSPQANAATGRLDPDLYDFQLLLLVVAMVACFASLAGLVIVGLLESAERRRARRRRAFEARLRGLPEDAVPRKAPKLGEPRNARLRALREVAHSFEKT